MPGIRERARVRTHARSVDPDRLKEIQGALEHELGFLYTGDNWYEVGRFLRSDWIRRESGQYFEVI